MEAEVHYCVRKRPANSQSNARQNQSTFSCLPSLRSILTISSHLLPCLLGGLFLSTFPTKTFCALLFPYMCQWPRQNDPSCSQAYTSPNTSSNSRRTFFSYLLLSLRPERGNWHETENGKKSYILRYTADSFPKKSCRVVTLTDRPSIQCTG